MINYIIGSIEEKREGVVVIENNGIGYEVFCSNNTLAALPMTNEQCKLLIYMQVKEDGICLFGFASSEEKDLFNKLINISGIGPKNALAVLSGFSLSDLMIAIVSGDTKMLSKIKGLGTKTAERIVLELKDKISVVGSSKINVDYDETVVEDAVQVLIGLGIGKNDAYKLARTVATPQSTIEDIVSKVLRGMA